MRPRLGWLGLVLVLGCQGDELVDAVPACLIEADGELVIEVNSGSDCAADHKGARLSCELEPVDGENRWFLSTRYQKGRDPNDSCAGLLYATCSVEAPSEGVVRIEYAQAELVYDPAEDGLPICTHPNAEG